MVTGGYHFGTPYFYVANQSPASTIRKLHHGVPFTWPVYASRIAILPARRFGSRCRRLFPGYITRVAESSAGRSFMVQLQLTDDEAGILLSLIESYMKGG